MRILAIDPGDTESAYVVVDVESCEPISFAKLPNEDLRRMILTGSDELDVDLAAIEMISSYGMAVGREVFDTCVWIGRFAEAIRGNWYPFSEPLLVPRAEVKLHHTGKRAATDANIIGALRERFAPGVRNHGKGTKDAPGFFYGFKADCWQAYALAVAVADRKGSTS